MTAKADRTTACLYIGELRAVALGDLVSPLSEVATAAGMNLVPEKGDAPRDSLLYVNRNHYMSVTLRPESRRVMVTAGPMATGDAPEDAAARAAQDSVLQALRVLIPVTAAERVGWMPTQTIYPARAFLGEGGNGPSVHPSRPQRPAVHHIRPHDLMDDLAQETALQPDNRRAVMHRRRGGRFQDTPLVPSRARAAVRNSPKRLASLSVLVVAMYLPLAQQAAAGDLSFASVAPMAQLVGQFADHLGLMAGDLVERLRSLL